MAKRRKRRKSPGEGFAFEFHGAYKRKADAIKKARKVKGWVAGRLIAHGDFRYVVMAERVPF